MSKTKKCAVCPERVAPGRVTCSPKCMRIYRQKGGNQYGRPS